MHADHPTDLLPAFALGSLEEDERKEVRRHLRDCEECLQELAIFQQIAHQLAFGAPSVGPPEHLKQRLMARIEPLHRTPGRLEKLAAAWPRLIAASALAALILAIALGVSNILVWQQLQRRQTGAFEHSRLVWLQATAEAPGATGTLIVGPEGSHALLVVNALTPLATKSQYQLWLIRNGRRTSGGVFSVTSDGRAKLLVSADRPLADFDAFGITIEPYGGSPGPTGKKVLGGKMKI